MAKRPTDAAHPKPDLRLVQAESEVYDLMRGPQTAADRVRSLLAQARSLAAEEVERLEAAMLACSELADEIAKGGDAYPVGARELSGRLAETLKDQANTLKAIMSRR